jgi:MFS family permease
MAFENKHLRLSLLMAMLFSFSLSALLLVVPLAALSAGYEATVIGLLVAVAAVSQISTRLILGWLMRRVADKTLLIAAAVLIALSSLLLMLSTNLIAFAISQLVQGAARALFWTSSQTHAVRLSKTAVKGLRGMNLAAGFGQILGPACAGILWSVSSSLPLLVAATVGCLAIVPAALLHRFPVFAKKIKTGNRSDQIGRRPRVLAASGMGAAAGAWRSVLDSYVPVALSFAGQSAVIIGLLLGLTNIAMMAGSAVSSWVRERGVRSSFAIGMLFTGIGLAVTAPVASFSLAAAICLTISGLGAGILQTVGPAIASDDVRPEQRGDVLALTGTYRAVALFVAPVGMAGMLAVLPLTLSLVLGGFLISAPAALVLFKPRK